nr:hypothetical protein [Planococcus glaciei]
MGFTDFNGYAIAMEWLLPVALLAGALVIAEGLLISKAGAASASPQLEKSSRGLKAAVYGSKRLWLIPLLLVVPGSLIEEAAPYWPQLPIGESSFSFILFPFVFGFQNRARKNFACLLVS